MNKRRVTGALATVVLAVSGALVVGSPAQASDYCPSGYVCVYDNANWAVKIGSWPGWASNNQYFAKNRASSWQNKSSYGWCTRDDATFPDSFVFEMFSNNSQSYVGATRNDKADYGYHC
jgi:hypothetical protein